MLKFETKKYVTLQDWDDLVEQTYKRPYSLQQQNGCMPRGTIHFSVPTGAEEVNDDDIGEDERGVSLKAWLARDPAERVFKDDFDYTNLFWYRHFYPDFEVLVQDLYEKNLIPAGEYLLDIDW